MVTDLSEVFSSYQKADSKQQTTDSRHQTVDSRNQKEECRQQTAISIHPTADAPGFHSMHTELSEVFSHFSTHDCGGKDAYI
jgi:hypothetical protein